MHLACAGQFVCLVESESFRDKSINKIWHKIYDHLETKSQRKSRNSSIVVDNGHKSSYRLWMSNTRRRVLCYIKKKEKRDEKMTHTGNVLINFEVLDIVLKHTFECLLHLLKLMDFQGKIEDRN